MFNRTGQLRSRKRRLEGEQLDISFPRRGRPTKFRRLEQAGQMRLGLRPGGTRAANPMTPVRPVVALPETIDSALDYLFPVGPMSEDELTAEFHRLFD